MQKCLKLLLLSLPAFAAEDEGSGLSTTGNKCVPDKKTTWGGKNIIEMCQHNFPDTDERSPKRIWFIWGHNDDNTTFQLRRDSDHSVTTLADIAKNDKHVGVGRIDCSPEKNTAWCSQIMGQERPTLVIITGKGKSTPGQFKLSYLDKPASWKNKIQSIKDHWREPKAKCADALFAGTKVVPMCTNNFPDAKDKRVLIALYNKDIVSTISDFKNTWTTMASTLGGMEQKRRTRIENIAKKHDIEIDLGETGGAGYEQLAGVGAVCCDCDDKNAKLCNSFRVWKASSGWAPLWVSNGIAQGDLEASTKVAATTKDLSSFVLSLSGYVSGAEHQEL